VKPAEEKEEKPVFSRADEFLGLFRKGAEFTQELLRENERLRYKIVQLEEELGSSRKPEVADHKALDRDLVQKVKELEKEREEILKKIQEVETENKSFAQRYVEVEEENNNLANLYIASFQLHSTLDFNEVLQVILEIIINLIGAEEFGILLLNEKMKSLNAVATEGVERGKFPEINLGQGPIGTAAKTGETYFSEALSREGSRNILDPLVCIPLKIKETIIGVIVIYKLLQQKHSFTPLDHELFTLLAGHAATAIFSSKMYSELRRKHHTIQGFINLLTK